MTTNSIGDFFPNGAQDDNGEWNTGVMEYHRNQGNFNQQYEIYRTAVLRSVAQKLKERKILFDPLLISRDDYKEEIARIYVKEIRDYYLIHMQNLTFSSASLEKDRRKKEKIRRNLKKLGLDLHDVFISQWEIQYWLLIFHQKNNSFDTEHLEQNNYVRLKQVEKDCSGTNPRRPLVFNSLKQINFIEGITPTIKKKTN